MFVKGAPEYLLNNANKCIND